MIEYVILHGGLGFLGYNLSLYYAELDDKLVILNRFKSIYKRIGLYNKITGLPNTIVIPYQSLDKTLYRIIEVYGCPRIVYNLAGVISGNINKLIQANAYTPYTLFKGFLSRKCRSLNIHISSFYPSQAFKRYVVDEEDPNLSDVNAYTYFEYTKAYGELLLRKLYERYGGKIIILRPGIIVGVYPYHPELYIQVIIGRYGIELYDERLLPYTPAVDIGKLGEFIYQRYRGDTNIFQWFNVTPYNLTLHKFMSHLHKVGMRNAIKVSTMNLVEGILPTAGRLSPIKMLLRYSGAK